MNLAATLALVLLALGLLPLALARGRGRRPVLLALAVWTVGAAVVAWATVRTDAGPLVPAAGRPIEVVAESYASSNSCRPCHPMQYATWKASWHRTMTQLATPETVRGKFDGREVSTGHRVHRLERQGDAFLVDGRRVVMTTGSHHMQAYWVSADEGRRVELVQLVYRFDEERWVPRRDVFVQPPAAAEREDTWNDNCIGCHATHGRPRLARGPDTHVNEFGISCEACHGPGEAHTAENRSPFARYARHLADAGDATIVNPAELSPRLASHVCASCHSITEFSNDANRAAYFEGAGDPYRPGDDLERTGHVVMGPHDPAAPVEPFDNDGSFWPDGPSRGSGREFNAMAFSACFGTGERPGDLSCISCHRMHPEPDDPRPLDVWADDMLGLGMDGDQACMQCHAAEVPDVAAHTHHKADSAGSRCYNCHMPFTTLGLVKAIRTHYVASPSVATELASGRPNACNLCHMDRSLAFTAEHLASWYGTPVPALDDEQREVAASIRWLLTGDARQRAIAAWHVGWEPAQQASGNDWIAPVLAPLLADPYPVVRSIATRSLATLPGYADFDADYLAPREVLEGSALRVWQVWGGTRRTDPELLIRAAGLDARAINALLARRDDTPVGVVE